MISLNPFAAPPGADTSQPESESESRALPISPDTSKPPIILSPSATTTATTSSSTTTEDVNVLSPTPIYSHAPAWHSPQAAWTSQSATAGTAAYDVNPKYTTANQSYTHRRRRSGVIASLITGNAQDPYRPMYRDWREHVSESSTGDGGYVKRQRRQERRQGRCLKVLVAMLLLSTVVLCGFWMFGGAMPLVSVSSTPLRGLFEGDGWVKGWRGVDWRIGGVQEIVGKGSGLSERVAKVKQVWLEGLELTMDMDRVKRWGRRSDQKSRHEGFDQLQVTTAKSFNPDLLNFGPGTLEKVTTQTIPMSAVEAERRTEDVAAEPSHFKVQQSEQGEDQKTLPGMVVGPPVQARGETSDGEEGDIPTAPNLTSNEESDDNDAKAVYRSRVQELWKKHDVLSTDSPHI